MVTLLRPPVLADPAQAGRARILFWFLWGLIVIVTVGESLICVALPQNMGRWLGVAGGLDVICLGLLALNGRGHLRLATHLLLWGLFGLMMGLAWTGGGIHASIIQFFPLVAMVAGLLLGWRVGVAAGVLCLLLELGLILAESASVLPASVVKNTPFSLWLGSVLCVAIFLLLQYLAVGSINQSLQAAGEELVRRKRTEESLRKSEAFLKRVFDASPVPIVVMDGTTHRYVDCNQAAVQIYRFASRQEVLGKGPLDFSAPTQYAGVPSSERARFYIDKAMAEGSVSFEWRHQRPDGEIWDGEVHLMSFQSEQGPFLQFTIQDITDRKRAEAQLLEAHAQTEAIINSTEDMIWSVDAEHFGMLMFNQALADSLLRSYGVRIQRGMLPHELLPPDRSGNWPAYFRRAIEQGGFEVAYEVPSTGASLEIAFHPISVDGRVVSISVFAKNVTERKKAQEKLRDSENRYRQLAQAAFEGLLFHDRGIILDANHVFAEIFGFKTVEELIGKDLFAVLPLTEESKAVVRERTGLADTGVFDISAVLPDGTQRFLETQGRAYTYLGRQARAVAVHDITERRRAEDALRESEAKLRAIFESSRDAIGISCRGEHMFANPAYLKLFGYPSNGAIAGTSILNHIAPSHRQMMIDHVERRAKGESVPSFYESRGINAGGNEFDMEISVATYPLHGEVYSVATIRDITQRKQAEAALSQLNAELEARVRTRTAELQAANKELEAFSYSVSHDLRAPLRAIVGFAQIMQEDHAAELSAEAVRCLRVISDNTRQMGQLIDDLLAFSRLSRQPVKTETLQMAAMAREVLAQLQAGEPAERRIDATVEAMPPCQADPTLLRQVLVNLISNALKYTRKREDTIIKIGYRTVAEAGSGA